jgi:hypothetical protein
MAFKSQTAKFTLDPSTSTQDLTMTGFGTVEAAIFQMAHGEDMTSETTIDHAGIMIGFTDCTSTGNAVSFGGGEHGLSTMDGCRAQRDDACIVIIDPQYYYNLRAHADWDAAITDGIRIRWNETDASHTPECVVTFLSGLSDVHVETVEVGATDYDVTTCGFEPDIVLCTSNGLTTPPTANDNGNISFGISANKSPVVNRCVAFQIQDNGDATSAVTQELMTNGVAGHLHDGSMVSECTIKDYDANGFTFDPTGTMRSVCFLAIKLTSGDNFWLGTVDAPQATGNASVTSPGFQPDFVIQAMTALESVDTVTSDGTGGSFGVGVFDGSTEFVTSLAEEDGVSTSNDESTFDSSAVVLHFDDGAAMFAATHVSMDANGWTLNYSAAPAPNGGNRRWFALAVAAGTAATTAECIGTVEIGGTVGTELTHTSESIGTIEIGGTVSAGLVGKAQVLGTIEIGGTVGTEVVHTAEAIGTIEIGGTVSGELTHTAEVIGTVEIGGTAAAGIPGKAQCVGTVEIGGTVGTEVKRVAQVIGTVEIGGTVTATIPAEITAECIGTVEIGGTVSTITAEAITTVKSKVQKIFTVDSQVQKTFTVHSRIYDQ